MKQMVCETCGSTDLVKQDGFFICQTCGTKYSVDEAKKMTIEGIVNVSGTVKIDESDKISKYMHMAITAFDSQKYSECEIYCNRILEIDNLCAKAWMLKGLSAIWQSSTSNIRINELVSCSKNSFKLAKTAEEFSDLGKLFKAGFDVVALAITRLLAKNAGIHVSNFEEDMHIPTKIANLYLQGLEIKQEYSVIQMKFAKESKSTFSFDTTDTEKVSKEILIDRALEIWNDAYRDYKFQNPPYRHHYETVVKMRVLSVFILNTIIPDTTEKIKEKDKSLIIKACKNRITIFEQCISLRSKSYVYNGLACNAISSEDKAKFINEINKSHNTIKYCDPSYVIPVQKTSGCYVATCVYGSYDCPQVWTLRRYRDNTLGSTWHGRLFIRTYYAISPTLVKWFGHTNWFKKMWKGKLDRMVAKLQSEGVENTPYEDKNW